MCSARLTFRTRGLSPALGDLGRGAFISDRFTSGRLARAARRKRASSVAIRERKGNKSVPAVFLRLASRKIIRTVARLCSISCDRETTLRTIARPSGRRLESS